MKTPWRVASRTAAPTVLGMSWYFRSRKTRKPRLRARSIAAGPAAVKSCEPILHPVRSPSRRASSDSASSRLGTSSATSRRSAALGEASVVLLQARDTKLPLQQRLDGADGGLGAVQRRVMGNVLGHRGAPDDSRVPSSSPVVRGVDHQRDLALLHEVDHVRAITLADLVDRLHRHTIAPPHPSGARRSDQRKPQTL